VVVLVFVDVEEQLILWPDSSIKGLENLRIDDMILMTEGMPERGRVRVYFAPVSTDRRDF
jgi:hypothetical protein